MHRVVHFNRSCPPSVRGPDHQDLTRTQQEGGEISIPRSKREGPGGATPPREGRKISRSFGEIAIEEGPRDRDLEPSHEDRRGRTPQVGRGIEISGDDRDRWRKEVSMQVEARTPAHDDVRQPTEWRRGKTHAFRMRGKPTCRIRGMHISQLAIETPEFVSWRGRVAWSCSLDQACVSNGHRRLRHSFVDGTWKTACVQRPGTHEQTDGNVACGSKAVSKVPLRRRTRAKHLHVASHVKNIDEASHPLRSQRPSKQQASTTLTDMRGQASVRRRGSRVEGKSTPLCLPVGTKGSVFPRIGISRFRCPPFVSGPPRTSLSISDMGRIERGAYESTLDRRSAIVVLCFHFTSDTSRVRRR